MKEKLSYISNKTSEHRYIQITKQKTDTYYMVLFKSGAIGLAGHNLNNEQYKKFRSWLNRQRIADFNTIVDIICRNSKLRVGYGWERNWTYHIQDELNNAGISAYVVNTNTIE